MATRSTEPVLYRAERDAGGAFEFPLDRPGLASFVDRVRAQLTTPVTTSVSPTALIRAEIDARSATDRDLGGSRRGCRAAGRAADFADCVEGGITEFLGRKRYERGDRAHVGSRNGHAPVTVKTTAGPVSLERPKLGGTDAAFASWLLGKHVRRTHALESLIIAGYVRGLSIRDVDASLADALGRRGGAVEVDGLAGVRGD